MHFKASLIGALCLWIVLGGQAFCDSGLDQGVRYYNQKNYRAAIKSFDQISGKNGQNATALYYRGLSWQQLGDQAQAKEDYRSVCDRFPASREAQLAATYLQRVDPQFRFGAGARHSPAAPPGSLSDKMQSLKESEMTEEEWAKLPDETRVSFDRNNPSKHIYMNAQVNGRPIRVIFDTGAEICLFGRQHLIAAGVKVDTTGPRMTISGVGASKSAQSMIADVTVGDITRRLPILVQDDLPTAPLLGETFFNGFRYDIDNRNGFIHFVKKQKQGSKARIFEPIDTISVPFTPAGNNMVVNVEVNGRSCPMYFDTGASGIVFSLEQAIMLGLNIPDDAQRIVGSGVGGATPGFKFNVDRIKLGPVLKTRVPVMVLQAGPPLPLLGQSFFGDRHFTIDNEKRLIKFVH